MKQHCPKKQQNPTRRVVPMAGSDFDDILRNRFSVEPYSKLFFLLQDVTIIFKQAASGNQLEDVVGKRDT